MKVTIVKTEYPRKMTDVGFRGIARNRYKVEVQVNITIPAELNGGMESDFTHSFVVYSGLSEHEADQMILAVAKDSSINVAVMERKEGSLAGEYLEKAKTSG